MLFNAPIVFVEFAQVKIYLENNYCNIEPGSCRLPNGTKFSRKYVVRIEATDEADNVGKCETEMFVGNPDSDRTPLLLLETALSSLSWPKMLNTLH